jgi:hypothetical protein
MGSFGRCSRARLHLLMLSLSSFWLLVLVALLMLPSLPNGEFSQASIPADTLQRLSLPNGYQLVRVRDSAAHQIRLVRHQQLIHTMDLPSQAERQGFAVNWVHKTPTGFALSIEYGTRIWVDRTFFFTYRKSRFYLVQIRTTRLDKAHLEKLVNTTTLLQPSVALPHFVLANYMPL